jgi:hypothetical protein
VVPTGRHIDLVVVVIVGFLSFFFVVLGAVLLVWSSVSFEGGTADETLACAERVGLDEVLPLVGLVALGAAVRCCCCFW